MLTHRYPTDAEPEENWDDDSEFQGSLSSNNGSRIGGKNIGPALFTSKLSVGLRASKRIRWRPRVQPEFPFQIASGKIGWQWG
jgi:hypothetical protein